MPAAASGLGTSAPLRGMTKRQVGANALKRMKIDTRQVYWVAGRDLPDAKGKSKNRAELREMIALPGYRVSPTIRPGAPC